MLNEDSEKKGRCAEYTEGKLETDVGLARVVADHRVCNILYSCMQSREELLGKQKVTLFKESSM